MNARKITLSEILIENFKGIKRYHCHFDGHNVTIAAANGVGKTSVYDAFLWLLFGKDSSGRTDSGKGKAEIRPLDSDNEPVRGLVVKVEATVSINGTPHVLRKEQHEKVDKQGKYTYPTLCWVNDVAKLVGKYNDYIGEELAPEEIFKLLTDLAYFNDNDKFHWTKRHELLNDFAGNISAPAGFESLVASCNGRSVEDFKKVLQDQKKRHVKERDEIGPRMDELNRGLAIPGESSVEVKARRELIQETLKHTEEKRTQLLAEETKRQEAIDAVNHLTCERLHRETQLKNQVPTELIAEKTRLETEHGERTQKLVDLQREIKTAQADVVLAGQALERAMATAESIRKELAQAESKTAADTCYACKQKLPEDQIAGNEARRKGEIAGIKARGAAAKEIVDENKIKLADYQEYLNILLAKQNDLRGELMAAESAKNARIAEIDEAIRSQKGVDPSTDEQWQQLTAKIEEAQKAIGKPVREQLETLEAQAKIVRDKIAQLDKQLAQADRAEQDKARIEELGGLEKKLAQQIADVDKQLAEIDEYKKTESKMIEAAVNGRFKYVEFRLFKYLLNGNIEPCCEATYKGVPFADLSTGQQILVGVDIVNVLSEHYGVSAPLFIDHSESITLPIEARAQTIRLKAAAGIKQLTVTVEDAAQVPLRKGA